MPPLANATDELSLSEQVDNILRWRPNPGVQEFALRIPDNVFEILFGGARGGGKTDAGIYWLIKSPARMNGRSLITHPRYRALALRRNANDMTDWIDRANRVYSAFGAKLVRNPQSYWTFPSGAKIYVGHLRDADSFTKYQGHEYQRMLIEELTQIKSELLYTKLLGSCRSTIPEIKAQIFLTTNPGGAGTVWVRDRFVYAATPKTFFMSRKTNRPAIYIPATVDDNPKLKDADPGYVQWLESLKETDINLYKAWRYGSWEVTEGAMFSEFRYNLHVMQDISWARINYAERIAALDWGFNDPTSIHWLARLPENEQGVSHIIVYREAYRNRITALQWGQFLGNVQKVDPAKYLVLPHDAFSTRPDGQTISEVIKRESGMQVRAAESLVRGAKLNRIALMHQALQVSPDGWPYMLIHSSCSNLIRTIPDLEYDDVLSEQMDENAEDHAYDSCTYGLMTLKPKFGVSAQFVGMRQSPEQRFSAQPVPQDLMMAVATQRVERGTPE